MASGAARLISRMLMPGLTSFLSGPTAIVNDITSTLKLMGLPTYHRQTMFNDANHFLDIMKTAQAVTKIPSNNWVPKEYQIRNWDMAPNRRYLVHGQAEYTYEGFEDRSTQWFSFYTDEELSDDEYLEMLLEEADKKNLYTDGRHYVSFTRIGSIERNANLYM